MDWATFYKQYEVWIVGVIFLILGIPASIIANRIDDYLKYRSLTAKDRKINSILNHYRYVVYIAVRKRIDIEAKRINPKYKRKYKLNDFDIVYFCGLGILSVGFLSANVVENLYGEQVVGWYLTIVMALSFPFYVFLLMAQFNYIRALRDVLRLDEYYEETVTKLKELGGNPEVLPKITKEIMEEVEKEKPLVEGA